MTSRSLSAPSSRIHLQGRRGDMGMGMGMGKSGRGSPCYRGERHSYVGGEDRGVVGSKCILRKVSQIIDASTKKLQPMY